MSGLLSRRRTVGRVSSKPCLWHQIIILIHAVHAPDCQKCYLMATYRSKHCTSAVLFLVKFCFSNLRCFTLLLQKSAVCMNAIFYGRVCFLCKTTPFDCGSANWSCISRSVKGDTLVCMVSADQVIPCNLSHLFCWLVCFTHDLAHLKDTFARLCRELVLLSL